MPVTQLEAPVSRSHILVVTEQTIGHRHFFDSSTQL
jgi:hypothetical protein